MTTGEEFPVQQDNEGGDAAEAAAIRAANFMMAIGAAAASDDLGESFSS